MVVSVQELLQCLETSGQMSSKPFPSHLFALLYFVIHSPHPVDLSVDVHVKVDVLLDVKQLKMIIPDSCIYYLPDDTLIVYEQIVLSTSAIICLQQKPLDVVFRKAYCEFFDPIEVNEWQQICIDFVHSIRNFMPKLLHNQKVHYILHLVESMKNYGPSAFSAERCSKGLQDLYSSDQVQSFFNSIPSKVMKANREIYKPGTARMATSYHGPFNALKIHCTATHGTVQELEQQDPPFCVIVHMGVMDGDIHEYRAVVSQSSELVHSGDYVKLHPPFQGCRQQSDIGQKPTTNRQ
ncbi:hypothetical protein EMCRGX_G027393 [Ephydatia muelleri]